MEIILWILGSVLYFVVGGFVTAAGTKKEMLEGDLINTIFTVALWPFPVLMFLITIFFMSFALFARWVLDEFNVLGN